jgi:hypothetical protein
MENWNLRFRNNIYQIIDQRVYRIIYEGQTLKLKTYPSEKNINEQIDIYLKYLLDLRKIFVKNYKFLFVILTEFYIRLIKELTKTSH